MNDPLSRHPGAETMAAFLEGKLAPGAIVEVAAHLRGCEECRTVTGEAARFELEEEEARARASRTSSAWRRWAVASVAAAAVIAIGLPLLRVGTDPMNALIEASPQEYRRVDGRLSGFPWARLHGGPRGPAVPPAEHELSSAAYKVLAETANDDAVEARHAAGVANLLIDQNAESLDELARAAGDSKDARLWNDLAAAQVTVAVRGDRTALLSSALASADRAIALDPKLADAYFNRALILEKMGTPALARQAWQRYLELDSSSEWSREARERLRALGEPSADFDFRKELARAAGDRDAILALVRRFPQDARVAGEGPLLGEWADAYVVNDAARAEESLRAVRVIAEELAASKGEHLLLDTVRTIERTSAMELAQAHRRLRDARVAFRKRLLDEALAGYREAEAAFRRAGSPMAEAAALGVAKCISDQTNDANTPLTALRARIDPTRYRALTAEVDWALSLQAARTADWSTAARFGTSAADSFRQLGERENTAWMEVQVAYPLERMCDKERAWRRRVSAMSVLTAPAQQRRVANILYTGAVGLAAEDDVDSAAAVMDLAIATPSNPELRGIILTDRARLAERAGDLTGAHRWLGEARAETNEIADAKLKEVRYAQIGLADAVLLRRPNPLQAIAALNSSIAYFEKHREGIFLSDALVERARTYCVVGRRDDAVADYQAALREIERQGRNADVSVEFLDIGARAIDECIDLLLDLGRAADAFAMADRAHALDKNAYRPGDVPEGVAVLEYMVMPRAVAIFCITRDGIVAKKVPIERAALESRVLKFERNMRAREDVAADAASLYNLLIAPVASTIANARELVIVPDRQLSTLPFAALHDGSRYLIQSHAMRVAPSTAAASSANHQPPTGTAVVIADPTSNLPGSREEAANIASIYGASVLSGPAATRARVASAIAGSSLIHYAGHAEDDSGGALLLAPDGNDSGLLTVADIARLDLRARPLVVLSACSTLSGETTHIAGMSSLARAFLGAGARTVVGTLWVVEDDVTGPLFRSFHEHLRAGEVPAGALRAAQLAMLQSSDPRLRHPSSWSAVEVLSNL